MKRGFKNALKAVIRYLNLTINVKRNGVPFRIPVIRGIGTQNIKRTEPWMVQLLEKIFSGEEVGIFIDIGANLGQTLLKVRSVSAEIPYYGFEPNPVCCFYLEELVKINKIRHATFFPVAIGENTNIISLYIHNSDDTAGSSASVLKDFKNSVISFQKNVPVFPLDFFYTHLIKEKTVNLIKIDVEGAELEAIMGSMDVIRAAMPLISCELLPPINKLTRTETLHKKEKIQRSLEPLGYSFYKVKKTSKDALKGLVKIEDIAQETVRSKGWDYLFVPALWEEFIRDKLAIEE